MVLLGLFQFKRLTAESNWSLALQKIENLKIIPTEGDVSLISQFAESFKSLDDSITQNISELLLLTMTSVYQIFLEAREHVNQDAGRQQQVQLLRRKSRALMIFVGMMQYHVAQEVCAKMTRMDIFMN